MGVPLVLPLGMQGLSYPLLTPLSSHRVFLSISLKLVCIHPLMHLVLYIHVTRLVGCCTMQVEGV